MTDMRDRAWRGGHPDRDGVYEIRVPSPTEPVWFNFLGVGDAGRPTMLARYDSGEGHYRMTVRYKDRTVRHEINVHLVEYRPIEAPAYLPEGFGA